MVTTVYIYSKLFSPALESEGRGGLEDDLEEFLGQAGEVTGGGSGERGWNIDLELRKDPEIWIDRLCGFLRDWGVPEDTYLKIYEEDADEDAEPRRVNVFNEGLTSQVPD